MAEKAVAMTDGIDFWDTRTTAFLCLGEVYRASGRPDERPCGSALFARLVGVLRAEDYSVSSWGLNRDELVHVRLAMPANEAAPPARPTWLHDVKLGHIRARARD